jgi:Cd2+/Zn2+-exporting ATPase
MDYSDKKNIIPHEVTGFTAIQGKGAMGSIDGRSYWLGSHRYLEERREETPEIHSSLQALVWDGHSVVVIGNEQRVIA